MTAVGRILALLLAVVLSVTGHLLLWSSGNAAFSILGRFGADVTAIVLPVLGIVLGVVLIGCALLTASVSSIGVLLLGVLHVIAGALFLIPGVAVVAFAGLVQSLAGVSRDLAYGIAFALPTGMVLVTGAVMLALGFAARGRRNGSGETHPYARVLALLVVPVAVTGALGIVGAGGALYVRLVQFASPDLGPIAVSVLLLGVLLFAASAVAVRWSSLGPGLAGLLLIVVGGLGILVPDIPLAIASLFHTAGASPAGIAALVTSGQVLLLGVLLAAAAAAAKSAAVRAARAHELDSELPADFEPVHIVTDRRP